MGISTICSLTFYSQEREIVEKIKFNETVDSFIYFLLNDGGATYNPDAINYFSDTEKEIMMIYFDENSMSIFEGLATVTQNIQDPRKLLGIWTKIKDGVLSRNTIENSKLEGFFNQVIDLLKLGIEKKLMVEITALDS